MSLSSLINTGTKVWLDGVEPTAVKEYRADGITGATSNPSIVSSIIAKGRFDGRIVELMEQSLDDQAIAWTLDDELVRSAQEAFLPVWEQTRGDDGYVSFELDPLIEDEQNPLPQAERVRRYVDLGKKWAAGHKNRMIKVPATLAGFEAMEELAAQGVTINVTLMFTARQYRAASDAIWRGARRRSDGLDSFKSVYSIFISRVDVYTAKRLPHLSPAAQGIVGLANAKEIWNENQAFWRDKGLRLQQEIVFASTGVKYPTDPPDKYVEALAGSDIMTVPPETLEAVQQLHKRYGRTVGQMPPERVLREIEQSVDQQAMERTLMAEGLAKFSAPQKSLIQLVGEKRTSGLPGREVLRRQSEHAPHRPAAGR